MVNTTDDHASDICTSIDGDCTLRDAITNANALPGPDTIVFDIPVPDVALIQPVSPLPPITGPVTIDGSAQTSPGGLPLITIDGSSFVGGGPIDGLVFASGSLGSSVDRVALTDWSTGNAAGVTVESGASVAITGSLLGTDSTGAAISETTSAISVIGSATIGGTTPAARNIISGNVTGVFIGGSGLGQGELDRCRPRRDERPSEQHPGHLRAVVWTVGRVGGTLPGEGNVISRNGGPGVRLISAGTSVAVRGNSIDGNGLLGIDLDPNGQRSE